MSRYKIRCPLLRLSVFLLIAVLMALTSAAFIAGESMGALTENIPDSDIGGAVSQAPDSPPSPATQSSEEPYTASLPSETDGNAPQTQSLTDPPADSGHENKGLFGIIVVIMVAVALIILILSFVPARKERHGAEEGADSGEKDADTRK